LVIFDRSVIEAAQNRPHQVTAGFGVGGAIAWLTIPIKSIDVPSQ
jgi:hypothetical protein